MSKHTPKDLAWIAGLFDGEGCIFIKNRKRKDASNRSFTLVVCMSNTEKVLLRPLLAWGGRMRPIKGTYLSRKPLFEWRVEAQKASRFLADILMYLRSKKRFKAIHALKFQLALRKKRGRDITGRYLETKKEDMKWREKIRLLIKEY